MAKARIWEDVGGGIHWVIKRNQHSQSCTGFANPGQLREDLTNLDGWIDETRNERPEEADLVDYDGERFGPHGGELIAQCEGGVVKVWPERMGRAGAEYLGAEYDAWEAGQDAA